MQGIIKLTSILYFLYCTLRSTMTFQVVETDSSRSSDRRCLEFSGDKFPMETNDSDFSLKFEES